MRWRPFQAEYDPAGYHPDEFLTEGGSVLDPQGIRVLHYHYETEGAVKVAYMALDPDGLEVPVAILTEPFSAGLVRMRKSGDTVWQAITADLATTWKLPETDFPGGSFLNMELEVTVPAGPAREILVWPAWQLPGTI